MCFLFSISHVYPRKADRSNPACRVLPRTHNKAIKRVNTLIPASSLRLCSRPYGTPQKTGRPATRRTAAPASAEPREQDRKSVAQGKSVPVRVDLGGRRIIQEQYNPYTCNTEVTLRGKRGKAQVEH